MQFNVDLLLYNLITYFATRQSTCLISTTISTRDVDVLKS